MCQIAQEEFEIEQDGIETAPCMIRAHTITRSRDYKNPGARYRMPTNTGEVKNTAGRH